MAVLVFAQLGNNALPTEGGQRGSGSTLVQPQKQDWESMPLDQNYADDDGGDGGDDDDDDGRGQQGSSRSVVPVPKNRIGNQCQGAALSKP